MKTAIVTGASSGIGLEITKKLLDLGYRVYGIARNFSKARIENDNFIEVVCDITETYKLAEKIKKIRKKEEIYILVNNAGVGYFGPHEELNPKKIHTMVATNLEAPLVLTQLLLRDLKKTSGYVINISSITAKKSSTYGCAYAATKAGLAHFSRSLFDETRKKGVKVVTIYPDMTKTPFYEHLDFREGDIEESYITPECVANAVETILVQRYGTVVTEITLQPQRHMITRKKRKNNK
ncbi:SDR family oxidoreductase [Caldisalinibacter kiritimatiensis]|uniref:3-oxoacyl-[acyl-carrier protein] reductase n=1 Tax=Caldisalinibacter kiritimatiensis TaxID=1304284 RepID=R1CX39_9FIRM|nr:SDR family oxidoreductase [Caldisalinibacter kiritimatiensis]EOD01194.1 3-oxoacyl-[acyl-carrier protein] reductase [Caldisalinibacter kiritimatiensis]